ncbi:hypothetical protein DXA13_16290 [Clostridium sp. AM58-1XD]|nr:hypothetical protein DXA13_16290 [Clostridium sp. AM58-1XD]
MYCGAYSNQINESVLSVMVLSVMFGQRHFRRRPRVIFPFPGCLMWLLQAAAALWYIIYAKAAVLSTMLLKA